MVVIIFFGVLISLPISWIKSLFHPVVFLENLFYSATLKTQSQPLQSFYLRSSDRSEKFLLKWQSSASSKWHCSDLYLQAESWAVKGRNLSITNFGFSHLEEGKSSWICSFSSGLFARISFYSSSYSWPLQMEYETWKNAVVWCWGLRSQPWEKWSSHWGHN